MFCKHFERRDRNFLRADIEAIHSMRTFRLITGGTGCRTTQQTYRGVTGHPLADDISLRVQDHHRALEHIGEMHVDGTVGDGQACLPDDRRPFGESRFL